MRFRMPGLLPAVAVVLAFTAGPANAQVVREPCSYRWEECVRREEVARAAQERALQRANQAEALSRRLVESRDERGLEQRIRIQDVPGIRSLAPRRTEFSYGQRDDLQDQVRRALEREVQREQRFARARASQERARETQERARERAFERALERALEQRETAERRREAARARANRVRWQS